MKRNTIIILLVVVLAIGILIYTMSKKNQGKPFSLSESLSNILDKLNIGSKTPDYNNLSPEEKNQLLIQESNEHMKYGGAQPVKSGDTGLMIVPHSGIVPKGASDKDFFIAMGFGDLYLDKLTKKDARIARQYTEQYLRKGTPIKKKDKIFKDVVRISKYINLFQTPTGI